MGLDDVRAVTLALLALVCGVTCVGVWVTRGTRLSAALAVVAAFCASGVYSQISLLGTPLTSRTWVNLGVAVLALAGLVWSIGHPDDHDDEPKE